VWGALLPQRLEQASAGIVRIVSATPFMDAERAAGGWRGEGRDAGHMQRQAPIPAVSAQMGARRCVCDDEMARLLGLLPHVSLTPHLPQAGFAAKKPRVATPVLRWMGGGGQRKRYHTAAQDGLGICAYLEQQYGATVSCRLDGLGPGRGATPRRPP
jgi:hypothetical protein